jgi:hypothetical protein
MCFEVLSQMSVSHRLWDIILNDGLLSLRISNTGSTYSHLTLIVGSDKAAEAPNSLLFATDVINQSIIDRQY